MPSYSQDDNGNIFQRNDKSNSKLLCNTKSEDQNSRKGYKEFGGRSDIKQNKSCPIIDDHSNSASPTRRQPNPSGMHSYRGFFGQSFANEERILEWPPPEARNNFGRPMITNFTAMFLPRPRPLHNPNVWFFGPTANVHQLVFEEVPTDVEGGAQLPVEQSQSSELQRTPSNLSIGTGNDADVELSSEAIFYRQHIADDRTENSVISETQLSNTDGRDTSNTDENTIHSYRHRSTDESNIEISPGIYTIPDSQELHNEINVHQRVVQPPPNQITYIMMHPNNEGTHLPDVIDTNTGDLRWALLQLLARLTSDSVEEM